MCYGGGSNSATQQAEQQQQEQTQAVSQNVAAINSAFAGRQQQYSNYLGALNQSYQQQLNLQQSQAARQLKFSLARGGLTGSSVAADQGGELQREMGQGQITAEEQAQGKLASLESADAAEKQQMISLASSGANIGNAAQQTATALQSNIQNAQSALGPNTLGQVFGGISNVSNSMNTAAATRLGLRAAQAYANPFSQGSNTNAGFSGGAGV
jgi:hypothetical protein